MNIEIKLGDPKLCDGCFCFIIHPELGNWCRALCHYIDDENSEPTNKRPQECIEKHGE